jgi:transcriptional regulator with XRE-family HTH domain
MSKASKLLAAPPYAVERALKTLGANLRTARLRRKLTLEEVAQKLGASRRIIADVENGKPSTSAGMYLAALWALGLLEQLADVADPTKDIEGVTLALSREGVKARKSAILDNDF